MRASNASRFCCFASLAPFIPHVAPGSGFVQTSVHVHVTAACDGMAHRPRCASSLRVAVGVCGATGAFSPPASRFTCVSERKSCTRTRTRVRVWLRCVSCQSFCSLHLGGWGAGPDPTAARRHGHTGSHTDLSRRARCRVGRRRACRAPPAVRPRLHRGVRSADPGPSEYKTILIDHWSLPRRVWPVRKGLAFFALRFAARPLRYNKAQP